MMRYLKLGFLALLGIVLLTISLANRDLVELRLLPSEAGTFLGVDWTIRMPLFLIITLSILVGLLLGFVWEWFRESKHRSAAASHERAAADLRREVERQRAKPTSQKDEILGLLEGNGAGR